ncbi:MAG: M28 family peptidase [Cyclobacteriaceae bacterium]
MLKKFFLFGALIVCALTTFSQDKKAIKYAETITQKDLKTHLSILASDSLEGRETGMKGQKMAAAYIANYYESIGLEAPVETTEGKSYMQSFDLQMGTYSQVYLQKGDERKENFADFLYYSSNETYGEEYIEVVFAGYGDSATLAGLDIEGKFVAFVNKEWSNFRNNLAAMKKAKAKGYFLILEDQFRFDFVMKRYGGYQKGGKMKFEFDQKGSKILLVGSEMTEWIFDKPFNELKNSGVGTSAEILINADMLIKSVSSENVMGFLRGSKYPEEVLVISAHYDHIGIIDGEINNGADDDGSGTSTVLELAEAFATAAKNGYRPKRSILFLTVSGEEKGLLGSEYYTENPIFPLKNTVTNLNIDMIGRVDDKHLKNPDYIYLIGSDKLSTELHELSEVANQTYTNLELDYTYNADDDPNRYYYRSDHYNFAKKGIPVIFYFNGTHADYHKPTDTIEKINFDKMSKIGKLVFYTSWEIANRKERIKVD